MKSKKLLFGVFILAIGLVAVSIMGLNSKQQYTPRKAVFAEKDMQGIKGAMEYLATLRNNQVTGELNPSDVIKARYAVENYVNPKAALNLDWIEMGPDNIGGRTRGLLIDNTTPSTMYAGGVSGGLWKSTTGGSSWVKIDDLAENLAVSCIAQGPNGEIYVGTGEKFASATGSANGGTGFVGAGIYKSTDGNTFSLLPSTEPAVGNNVSTPWAFINELAVNSNGRVFAATNSGLQVSDDGGTTWAVHVRKPNGTPYNVNTSDVALASDGTVVCSVNNLCYTSPNGDDQTFTLRSGTQSGMFPQGGIIRIEFAWAPSDANYLYAAAASSNGQLKGIYRSTDKGVTWSEIGPGGSSNFQPFGTQGGYDNVIAVYPNDKNHIIVGGLDMWDWKEGQTWTQKTLWFLDPSSAYYLHADHHAYKFHPTNPNVLYVGSDGGVSMSTDGGQTFQTMNRNYNTVQFYTVTADGTGRVMGGTQDNGTLFVDLQGNTVQNAREVMGGDGGYAAISLLAPEVQFATTYYGNIGRSADDGYTFSTRTNSATGDENEFFNARLNAFGGNNIGESSAFAGFVTPMILWENPNNTLSLDSLTFIADTNYNASETIELNSDNMGYAFNYVTPVAIAQGESVTVQDPVSAFFFFGGNGRIWMTRQALNFAVTPQWYQIATISGLAQSMTISKDGNHLFVGTSSGRLYRVSNILASYDSLNSDVSSPFSVIETIDLGLSANGRAVTSIAVDPGNADHLIVTLGSYNNTTYVYRTTDALSNSPTFQSKQGSLPRMPVYAAAIPVQNPNTVILGTEYGIYATDNILAANPQWTEENTDFAHTPVHMLYQQVYNYQGVTNYGVIYAGTHGRGFFRCEKYMSVNEQPTVTNAQPQIMLYPNPVVEQANLRVTLTKAEKVGVAVYDLSGKRVLTIDEKKMGAGSHLLEIDCSGLRKGTYILQLKRGASSQATKFIVH